MNYREAASRLAPLESFDPSVFVGRDTQDQSLCDFVLALALIYNDYRDVLVSQTLLASVEGADSTRPTPQLGLRNGLRNTLTRMQAGVVNELLSLVGRSAKALQAPLFVRLISQLSPEGRQAWQTVVDVAAGQQSAEQVGRVLMLIRHKIAFHYDAEQIGLGFRRAFIETKKIGEPMLSRGSGLVETRFYFADAAAQQYIYSKAQDEETLGFFRGQGDMLMQVHHALFELVTRFVQARGFAWRSV